MRPGIYRSTTGRTHRVEFFTGKPISLENMLAASRSPSTLYNFIPTDGSTPWVGGWRPDWECIGCCERDHDGDLNCHIHSEPGVLRMWSNFSTITAPAGEQIDRGSWVTIRDGIAWNAKQEDEG